MCLSKSFSRSTRACLHWLCTIISLHHGYSPVHTSPYQSDLLPAKLFLAETCLSLSHVQAADMSICMISQGVCVCACTRVCAFESMWPGGSWRHASSWIFLINSVKSIPNPLPPTTAFQFHAISSTKIGDYRNLCWSWCNFIDPFQPPSI